ncbi:MAG: NAD(P)-dependent oxidoreductase [Selenomonadaceae bacterium]|nr:NAD(P)-dependent oxidoreductase [Selenomonadaceae bacterium]
MKKNILVTGATGYIGRMLIKHLYHAYGNDVFVTALVRNRQKAAMILPTSSRIICVDITDTNSMMNIDEHFDHIIHCAAITSSSYMISHPVETTDGIVLGTKNVLNLALRSKISSMVYLSSMEVYGAINSSPQQRITEDKLGYVDLQNARSCYPMGKRMAENYCFSYYHQYNLPIKIARLAQTFGRGVDRSDKRVFAQFAKAVIKGEDIILHTKGRSMGNYCAIDDALTGIRILLRDGVNGEAYNIVNEDSTMTIAEMAEMVAREVAAGKISIRYDIPETNEYGYAADTKLCLSSEKIMNLGWKPTKNLSDMYRDLIDDWKK